MRRRRDARLGLPPSVGLGMEDPRLFDVTATAATTAAAAAAATAAAAPDAVAVGTGLLISFSAPRRQPATDCAALANRRTMSLMPLQPLAPPTPLKWPEAGEASSDRNWVLFEQSGALYSVFSIEPHVVLRIGRGGTCEEKHRTSNRWFARRFAERAIHGGANPLRVSTSSRSHYFVGIFHTKDEKLQYENYAYTFEATPPYRITAISKKALSLRGQRVRFVSSLTYLGHSKVVDEAMVGISYGSDDVEGRFAALTMRSLLRDLVDVSAHSTTLDGGRGAASEDGEPPPGLQLPFERQREHEALSNSPFAVAAGGGSVQVVKAGSNHEAAGSCFLLNDVRYDAPSIKMLAAPAADKCCSLCRGVQYCNSFSWSPLDGGTCWLKQWSGTATRREGCLRPLWAAIELRVRREAGWRPQTAEQREQLAFARPRRLAHRVLYGVRATRELRCVDVDAVGGPHSRTPRLHALPPATFDRLALCALAESGLWRFEPQALGALCAQPPSAAAARLRSPAARHSSAGSTTRLVGELCGRRGRRSRADQRPRASRLDWRADPLRHWQPRQLGHLCEAARRLRRRPLPVVLGLAASAGALPPSAAQPLTAPSPVIMSDDVHHRRLKLEAEDSGRVGGKEVAKTKDEEIKHYFQADHVLTISEVDKASILSALPPQKSMHESRFSIVRHVYADGVLFPLERKRGFEQRSGLMFVGNLNNPTNLHGLLWFLREVWPSLRKAEPKLTLRVVGSQEGESAKASGLLELLKSSVGVTASGYVSDSDMGRLLQSARVFIAPIRWATGIVTKQTLAHVHGLPSVITPTAARHVAPAPLDAAGGTGDAWSHIRGRYVPLRVAAVAETAADYAAAVLHVHRNESAWQELSENGARYARSGGGGKGVCPSGLADDWLAFWAKLQTGSCSGTF